MLKKIFTNFKISSLDSKKKKKFEIFIAVILSVVLIVIFFSGTKNVKSEKKDEQVEEVSAAEFIQNTEQRLETILSSIKGAGNVKVMVMAKESTKIVYAKNSENKESGDSISTSSEIAFEKNGSITTPIVEMEIYPEIIGVLVVADGAKAEKTKLILLNAVAVTLNIENSKIEVLPREEN